MAGLPSGSVFAGATAGWLHGLSCEPCEPIDVIMPPGSNNRRRSGVRYRRTRLGPADRTVAGGHPATAVEATLWEICRRFQLIEAVVVVDEALNDGLVSLDAMSNWCERCSRPGLGPLRRVLDLADPGAESPMETRLRLLLVRAGLPRPQTQVELRNHLGIFLARVDLYYPEQRVAIEYDGRTHKSSITDDNRRHNRLIEAGYPTLRFTHPDLVETPAATVGQVAAALRMTDLLANRPPRRGTGRILLAKP